MTLQDRSIVVTGAASGIGRQVALQLAGFGCKLTIADVNESAARDVVAEIVSNGGMAQFVRTDIAIEADVEAMVDAAVSAYGRLHGACNCAAISQGNKPLAEIEVEDWDRCHAINARGTFLCNKHEIKAMLESGGAIVNVSSTSAVRGFPGLGEYASTKASIVSITRSAAVEYSARGIRVNAIMPGFTLTENAKVVLAGNPELAAQTVGLHPIGRGAEPEEIAASVCWLLSDQASFMTGAIVPVDGGMTA